MSADHHPEPPRHPKPPHHGPLPPIHYGPEPPGHLSPTGPIRPIGPAPRQMELPEVTAKPAAPVIPAKPAASATKPEVQTAAAPQAKKMKIEAVTTCVNYADILAYTLPLNLRQFDKIVVATSPGDKATHRVCEFYGVDCHKTDAFNAQWEGQFCKGKGINSALGKLDKDAWIVHMDSDIALQPNFRRVIENADLDPTMIYGVDRAEFKSFEDWQKFFGQPEPHTAGMGFFINIAHTGQQLGTRVAFGHKGGYIPIGFFQMWHADSGITKYIEGHTDAGKEDSVFATNWPRRKRALIPEVLAYHLEAENAPMGINWKGRQSKPFGVR